MLASAAPPRTVKSSPQTTTWRPSMRPVPATRLAGVKHSREPSVAYCPTPASAPISSKVPGSSRRSMRSRTVMRPASCWRRTRSSPPIRRANSSRRRSSSSSGRQFTPELWLRLGMKVLVTGGTGLLGARLVPRLAAAGHQVRVMTHSGRKVVGAGSIDGDLLTGAGVAEAVAGAECVVHLASAPRGDTQKVDVLGTKGLVEMARRARVPHLIYLSIVGVDRVPYSYYKAKLEAEKVIQAGQLPYTILRSTQFFSFLDGLLRGWAERPVIVIPKGW